MNDQELSDLMQSAEDALVAGQFREAGQALEQIARCFAAIGQIESFFNIRKHIIDMAKVKTNVLFIDEQLTEIERDMQNARIIVAT